MPCATTVLGNLLQTTAPAHPDCLRSSRRNHTALRLGQPAGSPELRRMASADRLLFRCGRVKI